MEMMILVYELIESLTPLTNDMDKEWFTGFFCMLAEEWCKAHGEDVVDFISLATMMITEVNAEEGRY